MSTTTAIATPPAPKRKLKPVARLLKHSPERVRVKELCGEFGDVRRKDLVGTAK